ncbi:MAG: GNAT family N-acetyltransferase [Clostridia bacterium]|nr:GNAT family N-acetyltransferase [Clostridia bacterium]
MKEYNYRLATIEDLNNVWDKEIKQNSDDKRYIEWKKTFIKNNVENKCKSFVISQGNKIIGQGTLILSSDCFDQKGRSSLCNGKDKGNISALRIDKEYEGQGHISKLIKVIENYAKQIGLTYLTIGAEAKESRNLSIYLHWGYNKFLMYEIDKSNSLILFYGKKIR